MGLGGGLGGGFGGRVGGGQGDIVVTETITMDNFVSTVVVQFNTVAVTLTDLQVETVTAATFQVRFFMV